MHPRVPSGSFSCPVRHTHGTGDTWANLGSNIHARNAHTRTGHERSTRRPRAVASGHTDDGRSLHGTGTFPPQGKLVARTCPARLLRVKPWLIRRTMIGQYHTLFRELDLECAGDHMNYIRMARNLFHEVLHCVLPRISKLDCRRKLLEPGLKLVVTLRHLATGASYKSLQYFRVSTTSGGNLNPGAWRQSAQLTDADVDRAVGPGGTVRHSDIRGRQSEIIFGNTMAVMWAESNGRSRFYNWTE